MFLANQDYSKGTLFLNESSHFASIGMDDMETSMLIILMVCILGLISLILVDFARKRLNAEEMRQKNIELERANAELRELDRMKDNFIANISHELRTPLTSIKGSIDLLLKGLLGELDEKKKEALSICKRNSSRLIDLVNDLLEIQHLESGHTKLELQPLEVEALIPDLVEKASNDCHKEGIDFETRINPDDQDRVILGDPTMISHAMSNLLSNAIKFSDQGTISIEVAYLDGEVHLSVTDEGIGIPEDMRDKIFDKFTQADGSMTRTQGGTGLGLALTRIIVEKHGGRIWVESGRGKGSKFTFSLPCHPKKDDTILPL
jgi:signal transduction histidine kinase